MTVATITRNVGNNSRESIVFFFFFLNLDLDRELELCQRKVMGKFEFSQSLFPRTLCQSPVGSSPSYKCRVLCWPLFPSHTVLVQKTEEIHKTSRPPSL